MFKKSPKYLITSLFDNTKFFAVVGAKHSYNTYSYKALPNRKNKFYSSLPHSMATNDPYLYENYDELMVKYCSFDTKDAAKAELLEFRNKQENCTTKIKIIDVS